MKQSIVKPVYSLLRDAPAAVRQEFEKHVSLKRLIAGEQLTLEGSACHYFPLVHSGVIRVYKVGANGQEVTLYRIQEGEGCVLTMTCMLNASRFPAFAVVETDCEVFLVPASTFRTWVKEFEFWREFVVRYLTKVVSSVVGLIEEIAFKNVEVRIMEFLIRHTQASNVSVRITHQELSQELGTAREVVSRTLKELERQGLISLARKSITILDLSRLKSKARLL